MGQCGVKEMQQKLPKRGFSSNACALCAGCPYHAWDSPLLVLYNKPMRRLRSDKSVLYHRLFHYQLRWRFYAIGEYTKQQNSTQAGAEAAIKALGAAKGIKYVDLGINRDSEV